MKRFIQAVAIASSFALAGIASAATFDFDADTEERGGQPLSFSSGGIGLDATGWADGGDGFFYPTAYAYLDAGIKSGLGVCKVLRGPTGNDYSGGQNECNPSSDDNLLGGEELLGLQFSVGVIVDSLSMWGNHVDLAAETAVDLFTWADGWTTHTLVNGQLSGLNLALTDGFLGLTLHRGYEGYLSMISVREIPREVPVPGTLALLGLGLAGLGMVRRKQAA